MRDATLSFASPPAAHAPELAALACRRIALGKGAEEGLFLVEHW